MTDEPWWKRVVVYQIYPRSFAEENRSDDFAFRFKLDRGDGCMGSAESELEWARSLQGAC